MLEDVGRRFYLSPSANHVLHREREHLYCIILFLESFQESMHGRVARVRIWYRVERRGRPPFWCRTGRRRGNNPANCRQDFQVRESHLIRTTGHGTPESINPWRISLSLSLCPPRVTKNRIRAAIEPSSLSFSPPPQPGMHLHAKKHRCKRIEKGFSLLSDARQLERILDSREGNSMHSSNSKRMKFRVVLEITTIFSLFNKIYLT